MRGHQSFSYSQNFVLLWIPKVRYCDHNSPPLDLTPITTAEILIFTQSMSHQ